MPVLPLFYIAVCGGSQDIRDRGRAGLRNGVVHRTDRRIASSRRFPVSLREQRRIYRFVELQRDAAAYIEATYPASTITSAWPFPDALRRPEFGYVTIRSLCEASKTSTLRRCLG